MANSIRLPQYPWSEPRELELPLPDSWQVDVYNIPGYNRPAMTPSETEAAIASPIGMPPIREAARGKNEVVILFDDMTRSTRTYKIVPFVLKELAEAGIADNQIRFICALGNHQALDRTSLVKKLGEETLARFPVYNHCPFMNCTHIGTTSYGTEVAINAEVLHCDFKIGIGQITPHPTFGFGGGAKMILPGVAAYDTVAAHHSTVHAAWREKRSQLGTSCMGVIDENPSNADAREAVGMVGLDVKIDCLANMWGEPVAIFAGALEPAYKAGVEAAKSHYFVPTTPDNDIVIANSYIKAGEAYIALSSTMPAVTQNGGDIVLVANSPAGHVTHYLLGEFGKTIGGRLHRKAKIPPHINHIIIYTEYPEVDTPHHFLEPDKVLLLSDWDKVIKALQEFHPDGAKVAVYPSADIQHSNLD